MTLQDRILEYYRSARDRDDPLTELLSVELAPYFDEIAAREDADPQTPTPMWGYFA